MPKAACFPVALALVKSWLLEPEMDQHLYRENHSTWRGINAREIQMSLKYASNADTLKASSQVCVKSRSV